MPSLLAAMLLMLVPGDVEVRTLDGRTTDGTIVALDENRLTIRTTDRRVSRDVSWYIDKLIGVFSKKIVAAQDVAAVLRIDLIDGSKLVARQYTVAGSQARITLGDARTIDLPSAKVAAVRLREASAATADEWLRLTRLEAEGDLLVVGNEHGIDYHEGILHDVTDTVVQFEFDGTVLPAKRSKVYGLVYHRLRNVELPEAICRITDTTGSQWAVRAIGLSGSGDPPDRLTWITPAGVKASCPMARIRRIDFSQGKIVFLSDLKPESTAFTPYFGTTEARQLLGRFYALRTDRNLESAALQLGGKRYSKGLAMHSRTEVVYRLPGRFGRFKATAGIDDGVRPGGSVRLVIRGDDRVLFEATVRGTDPPVPIDLDVTDVRRLTILADFADNMDIADHLDLCEARVIK